jgi:hypothetical protein
MCYLLLVFLWVVVVGGVVYFAFVSKIRAVEVESGREIDACGVEYENNR